MCCQMCLHCGCGKGQPKASEEQWTHLIFFFLRRTKRDCEPNILQCRIESWMKIRNPAPFWLAAVCHPATETMALNFSLSCWRYSFIYLFFVVIAMEAIAIPHVLDSGICEWKGSRWLVIKEESWCLRLVMCIRSNQLWWGKRQKRPVTV